MSLWEPRGIFLQRTLQLVSYAPLALGVGTCVSLSLPQPAPTGPQAQEVGQLAGGGGVGGWTKSLPCIPLSTTPATRGCPSVPLRGD